MTKFFFGRMASKDTAADRYLQLLRQMDQGFCIIEVLFDETGKATDYRFLEVNTVFEKQTGLRDVTGKTMLELQPAHEEHWFSIYGEVAKTRRKIHFENKAAHLSTNGTEQGVWYEVYAYPFGEPEEHQVAVLFNDITERKKAEEALRTSRQRLQRVLETDAVGVLFFNYEGVLQQANHVFLQMTGYTQQQIDRGELTWRTMTPPEWVTESEAQMARFGQTGRVGPYEKEYFLADGSRRWMLFSGRDLGDGFIAEYCIDITQHKLTEKALRKSEAQLAATFEMMPVALGFFDTTGKLILSNKEMKRYLPNGIIPARDDKPVHRWAAYDDEGNLISRSDYPGMRALRGETVLPGLEMIFTDDDGNKIWTRVASAPFRNETGDIIGAVSVISDIDVLKRTSESLRASEEKLREFNSLLENKVTERTRELKRSQEKLQESNQHLQDTVTRLESFNYIASHDLQEPLRKIETFSALLSEHDLQNAVLENYLGGIRNSSTRMRKLIDDLLAYSRLGRSDVFEHTDLNQILENVKTDYALLIREKNAVIRHSPLPSLPCIPFQMYQLFSNLIGNSLKFTERYPEISITCNILTELPFKSATSRNDLYAEISVADNGIGFDPQYSERIFQVFQRLHSKTKYPGTGIGLSIVDRVVKNHEGYVQATSVLGEGAVFKVYLPCGVVSG